MSPASHNNLPDPPASKSPRHDHDEEGGERQSNVAGMMVGTALMFIDFILENSAKNAGWTGYPMPTHSSAKPYAELTRNEPELQVTIEDLEKGQQFANLEGADREAWDRTWTEVKAA